MSSFATNVIPKGLHVSFYVWGSFAEFVHKSARMSFFHKQLEANCGIHLFYAVSIRGPDEDLPELFRLVNKCITNSANTRAGLVLMSDGFYPSKVYKRTIRNFCESMGWDASIHKNNPNSGRHVGTWVQTVKRGGHDVKKQ